MPIDETQIYLAADVKLNIGESKLATVFGYDECPSHAIWLFNVEPSTHGCIKLSGKKKVKVRFLDENGLVTIEAWNVTHSTGRIALNRANGFIIHE